MIAERLVETHSVSQCQACWLRPLGWSSYYYRRVKKDERTLIVRIGDLVAVCVLYGYRRITVLMQREVWSEGK